MVSSDQKLLLRASLGATICIFAKCFLTANFQGKAKGKAGVRPNEDSKFFGQQDITKQATEEVERWNRIVMNDLENIPMGLIIIWASTLTAENATAHLILCITFCVGRYLHTVSYALGLQPWRSLSYFLGLLSVIAMLINDGIGTF
eukprot:c52586_g1_i1.p1 GENE.c52586_g1_i1~~c52586_g1_i1.p1  ORF type:complete len:160 (+),score=36.96 c52586_g1_i1:44-481(+)